MHLHNTDIIKLSDIPMDLSRLLEIEVYAKGKWSSFSFSVGDGGISIGVDCMGTQIFALVAI